MNKTLSYHCGTTETNPVIKVLLSKNKATMVEILNMINSLGIPSALLNAHWARDSGRTPLMIAAYKIHYPDFTITEICKIMRAIIQKGGNVNGVDCNGSTALTRILKYMTDPTLRAPHPKGQQTTSPLTPDEIIQLIQPLLEANADVNRANSSGETPLSLAIIKAAEWAPNTPEKAIQLIQKLLHYERELPNFPSQEKPSYFYQALDKGLIDIALLFLDFDVNSSFKNHTDQKFNPQDLTLAIKKLPLDILEKRLSDMFHPSLNMREVEFDYTTREKGTETALTAALKRQIGEPLIKIIVNQFFPVFFCSSLFYGALRRGHFDVASQLLDGRVKIDLKEFICALECLPLEILEAKLPQLLQYEFDINEVLTIKNSHNPSILIRKFALQEAIIRPVGPTIAAKLVKAGATLPTKYKLSCLHWVVDDVVYGKGETRDEEVTKFTTILNTLKSICNEEELQNLLQTPYLTHYGEKTSVCEKIRRMQDIKLEAAIQPFINPT